MDMNLITSLGIAFATFLVYLLTLGMYWWHKRMRLSFIFLRGAFFAVIVAAYAYTLRLSSSQALNLVPLADWRRITEIGSKVIWKRAGTLMIPFAIVGLVLPLAFRKMNTFGRAAIAALIAAVVFAVGRLAMGVLDIDEILYVFWGFMVGFSLMTFIGGLFPKLSVFASMHFRKNVYVIGVAILMGTFFSGVGMLLAEDSTQLVELQIFGGSPLPASDNIIVSTSLSIDREKIPTYDIKSGDLNEESARIATIFGINAEPQASGTSTVVYSNGNKSLTYYEAGNWTYENLDAAERGGTLPNDETCVRLAEEITSNGAAPNYDIYNVEVIPLVDGETEREVWVHAAADGMRVIGACEFHIWIGTSGEVTRIMRIEGDLQKGKSTRIISSQDAHQLVLSNGLRSDGRQIPIGNTLYEENPSSVNITQANVCYWPENTKGILQPIWVFQATATLEDGSSKPFEIYVPAVRY